ncbi:MAG: RNA-binding S4 domain-containing protein [Christensenellaceae bacterium]|nr:RNA-binding S4 domain-containing protein [Christensenellaceae bacterium]
MRIDKYLKVSRIIKRRTVANEACNAGRVFLNGKVAKSGNEVKIGDIIEIKYGNRVSKYKVLEVKDIIKKDDAQQMYQTLSADIAED